MNILLLTNHLNIGGITRYVLNLSYGLKKRGHKVFVGSVPGWGGEFLENNEISLLELPLKTKSILSPSVVSSYFILKRFIRREGIDIIHAQTRITQFLGFLLSKRLNIAYVCTFHGFYRPHPGRKMIPCLGDLTIAVSQAVGRHLIEDFNLHKKDLRVIYNSVNLKLNSVCSCRKQGLKGSKDYAYLKGSPTLGIVARLSKEKGHLVLFSAFSQLIKEYPQARLLIAGSGKKEGELRKWVKGNNLAGQIIFLGNVSGVDSVFSILDVSILPSFSEGFALSVLEAQAEGVPVVASPVGGINEIVEHRQTGILVKPGNSEELYRGIKLLLEDVSLRQKIINNAKKQFEEKFSLGKMTFGVEQVYTEAVGKRRV